MSCLSDASSDETREPAELSTLLHISEARAAELFKSSGSVAAAVELHFSRQEPPSSETATQSAAAGGTAATTSSSSSSASSGRKAASSKRAAPKVSPRGGKGKGKQSFLAPPTQRLTHFFKAGDAALPLKRRGNDSERAAAEAASTPALKMVDADAGNSDGAVSAVAAAAAAKRQKLPEDRNGNGVSSVATPIKAGGGGSSGFTTPGGGNGNESSSGSGRPSFGSPTSLPGTPFSPAGALTPREGGGSGCPGVDQQWQQYRPVSDAPWRAGEPAPYQHLADTLEALIGTTKRLRKADILVNCFRSLLALSPGDVVPALYLCSNSVGELGVGGSMVSAAVQQATGATRAQLHGLYRIKGDLGDAAFALKSNVRLMIEPKRLTIGGVYDSLTKLSRLAGQGSEKRKKDLMAHMIQAAKGVEVRFVVRTLLQHIRTGATLVSVLAALAMAVSIHEAAYGPLRVGASAAGAAGAGIRGSSHGGADGSSAGGDNGGGGSSGDSGGWCNGDEGDGGGSRGMMADLNADGAGGPQFPAPAAAAAPLTPPDGRRVTERSVAARVADAQAKVKRAFDLCPHLGELATALLQGGVGALEEACQMRVGMPITPMLSNPSTSVCDLFKKLGGRECLVEYKYDGERSQIHLLEDGDVRIFSRNLDNTTGRYQDVARLIPAVKTAGVSNFIIDAELVACDPAQDYKILPFQMLSTRSRATTSTTVAVCAFVFDLMCLNGLDLTGEPLSERRRLLQESFAPQRGKFEFATATVVPGLIAAARAAATTQRGQEAAMAAFMRAGALMQPSPPTAEPENILEEGEDCSEEAEAAVPAATGATAAAVAGSAASALSAAAGGGGDDAAAAAVAAIVTAESDGAQCGSGNCGGHGIAELVEAAEMVGVAMADALQNSCEGVMAKALAVGSEYTAGRHSESWVKLKKDYVEGLGDSFDLVPIGAWWGNGRKAGWYSPVLLACYDPETEDLQR
ncbi:unnamed protein product [Phaeothamnion confervicola]